MHNRNIFLNAYGESLVGPFYSSEDADNEAKLKATQGFYRTALIHVRLTWKDGENLK